MTDTEIVDWLDDVPTRLELVAREIIDGGATDLREVVERLEEQRQREREPVV